MHNCTAHSNCIATALAEAEDICAAKDLRFTDIRRNVLELVWTNHGPIKAYDILERLDSRIAAIKPPTVYRALDFLVENGLVHKLDSLNAFAGCSHPLKHSECYFLICTQCGEAKECCNTALSEVILDIADENKFQVHHTTLEISGECGECHKP